MKSLIKKALLHICKALGLFHLSRRLVRKKLLILCYHGFELDDEAQFQPGLFMMGSTFQRRLEAIERNGFRVLPLPEALRLLDRDELPANSICITIDDGFYGVRAVAADQLKAFNFPATLYVTTYYVLKETPIFRHAIRYAFWKSPRQSAQLDSLNGLSLGQVDLADTARVEQVSAEIVRHGEEDCDEPTRVQLSRRLFELLGVDYAKLESGRGLSLVTESEIHELMDRGIDIQLHTHTHRFPANDGERSRKEIENNRSILSEIVGKELTHFCYPSGVWNQRQFPWLEESGVTSATTCLPGFNDKDTHRLALYRVLDDENLTQIQFEAELFGFIELLRGIRGANRKLAPTAE